MKKHRFKQQVPQRPIATFREHWETPYRHAPPIVGKLIECMCPDAGAMRRFNAWWEEIQHKQRLLEVLQSKTFDETVPEEQRSAYRAEALVLIQEYEKLNRNKPLPRKLKAVWMRVISITEHTAILEPAHQADVKRLKKMGYQYE